MNDEQELCKFCKNDNPMMFSIVYRTSVFIVLECINCSKMNTWQIAEVPESILKRMRQ